MQSSERSRAIIVYAHNGRDEVRIKLNLPMVLIVPDSDETYELNSGMIGINRRMSDKRHLVVNEVITGIKQDSILNEHIQKAIKDGRYTIVPCDEDMTIYAWTDTYFNQQKE